MPLPKGLSRKGREKYIAAQLDAISLQLTNLQEALLTMLNANEQAIVDALNASTNKVSDIVGKIGDAVTTGTQAIKDLFANQSSITLADVQPHLDALDQAGTSLSSAADALQSLATTDDPALTPSAPPIVVTPPSGETPVPISGTTGA